MTSVNATINNVLLQILLYLQTTFKTDLQHVLHGWYQVLQAVARTIPHNRLVTSLTMWETHLNPPLTALLAAGLAGNRRITFLDLSHNKLLRCKGAASLAKALDPLNNFGHTLNELRLDFCGVTCKGVTALSETLAFNTVLKV
jgi:Ran GTPase-activating protein (RanGAP) involved in mRNA processing and transport